MHKKMFSGCGTAMFTPFRSNNIDTAALQRQTEAQVAAGIDFLVPLGTTGETPTLSDEEKRLVFQTVKAAAGKTPVMVGVGSNSLGGTLGNIRLLSGADAFLVVVPFYNKPPQRGLYAYFKAVAESTDKPIVLYNVPGRTGTNMEAQTTLRLASDVPNIVGIKEASSRREQILEIIEGAPEDFSVLSGNDDETFALMKAGADGVVSVASNVAPALLAGFVHALLQGRTDEAEAMDRRLRPLFRDLFMEPNPIPGKAAMTLLGAMENSLRLPLVPALEGTVERMRTILQELELWK